MHSRFLTFALGALLISTSDAQAQGPRRVQWGVAAEWRGQLGSPPATTDRRSGLAARLVGQRSMREGLIGRVDFAYSQMQYDRRDELGTVPINESGLELGGFLRQDVGSIGESTPYLLAGAIASFRMSCGVDSAFDVGNFVNCEGSDQFLLGWGAGAGARRQFIGGWDWFFEARVLGNVTSADGKNLLAIGIGAAF